MDVIILSCNSIAPDARNLSHFIKSYSLNTNYSSIQSHPQDISGLRTHENIHLTQTRAQFKVSSLRTHETQMYGKCSKILNTFPFLCSNKMLVIRAGTHKMLVRIENGVDPDQTASV